MIEILRLDVKDGCIHETRAGGAAGTTEPTRNETVHMLRSTASNVVPAAFYWALRPDEPGDTAELWPQFKVRMVPR